MQIPSIKTVFTISECRPSGYLKRDVSVQDFKNYDNDEFNNIEGDILNIAEDCDFEIPYTLHHVRKINEHSYQIQIFKDNSSFKVERTIDVQVTHTIEFLGKFFELKEIDIDI